MLLYARGRQEHRGIWGGEMRASGDCGDVPMASRRERMMNVIVVAVEYIQKMKLGVLGYNLLKDFLWTNYSWEPLGVPPGII